VAPHRIEAQTRALRPQTSLIPDLNAIIAAFAVDLQAPQWLRSGELTRPFAQLFRHFRLRLSPDFSVGGWVWLWHVERRLCGGCAERGCTGCHHEKSTFFYMFRSRRPPFHYSGMDGHWRPPSVCR
jgi:hypothetical protein